MARLAALALEKRICYAGDWPPTDPVQDADAGKCPLSLHPGVRLSY